MKDDRKSVLIYYKAKSGSEIEDMYPITKQMLSEGLIEVNEEERYPLAINHGHWGFTRVGGDFWNFQVKGVAPEKVLEIFSNSPVVKEVRYIHDDYRNRDTNGEIALYADNKLDKYLA